MSRILSRSLFILALLFVNAVVMTSVASAANVEMIFITNKIDITDFPNISLSFRAVDSDNNVPEILTNDEIVLYENGQPATNYEVGTPIDGPVTVFFVIDLNQASNFSGSIGDTVRDSLIHFTDGYFRDGVDTVAVLARVGNGDSDETVVLLEPTQSASQFTSAVNSFDLQPTGRTEGLLGVSDALTQLSRMVEPGHGSTAVIYISRLVEWPQQSIAVRNAQNMAALGREQYVKLYSFHTDANYDEPLRVLSAQSEQGYLPLTAVQNNSSQLNQIYQSIMDQGVSYTLNYRSQIGDLGPRTVVIAPAGTPAALAKNPRTYNVSLQAPIVEIEGPVDNAEFTRTASKTGDESWNYDLDTIPITAELTTWPDNIEREIEQVQFIVDNMVQHTVENPAGNTFRFNLDISKIEEPKSLAMQIRLRDELGIEAESDSITINIAINRDRELTAQPTQPPPPTPEPIIINEDPCLKTPGSAACTQSRILTYAPWGIVVLLSVVMLVYRQRVVAVAGAAGGALRDRAAIVRQTILGGGGSGGKKVLAKINVVVARRDLQGEKVKIYTNRTTIGRNPKLCDVLLYDEDEVSSVSGQHCTIQFDRGNFLITDDNSANGTMVNGELLPPNNPRRLKDGDEIILGDLFHRGAKLIFEAREAVGEPEPMIEASSTIIDSEFREPILPTVSSETILDLEDDPFGTVTDELPQIDVDPKKHKDSDWLDDLE